MVRRYESVIFDAGGTLIDPISQGPFYDFFTCHGIATKKAPRNFALNAMQRHRELSVERRAAGTGANTSGLLWLLAFEYALGPHRALAPSMLEWFLDGRLDAVYVDVPEALSWLKGQGYRLGILSNFRASLGMCLERIQIRKYFDFLTVSDLEGMQKPSRALFEMAIRRSGMSASQLLYVGDNPETDIDGARLAGVDAVLLDRNNLYSGIPALRITTLNEVCSVLVGKERL